MKKKRSYQSDHIGEVRFKDGWIIHTKQSLSKSLETFAKQNLALKGETVIAVEQIVAPIADVVIFD